MSRDHLDPETLARLAEGDRRGIDEDHWRHLAACAECKHAYLETVEVLHRWLSAPDTLPTTAALLAAGHRIAPAAAAAQERAASRRWGWRLLGFPLGGLAMAGSLALALLLPPRPTEVAPAMRGESGPAFTRPVEGELLVADACRLAWTPVPGATRYRLELRDDAGLSLWEVTTAHTAVEVPATLALRPGQRYRALLAVQPADLLAPGRVSVSFRAGSAWARALHQVRWPDRRALFLAAAGTLLLGVSLLQRGERTPLNTSQP